MPGFPRKLQHFRIGDCCKLRLRGNVFDLATCYYQQIYIQAKKFLDLSIKTLISIKILISIKPSSPIKTLISTILPSRPPSPQLSHQDPHLPQGSKLPSRPSSPPLSCMANTSIYILAYLPVFVFNKSGLTSLTQYSDPNFRLVILDRKLVTKASR